MPNYKMGFWNYVDTGKISPAEAVSDWEDLACNLVMSFEFKEGHDKQEFIKMLDECYSRDVKVIICDARTKLRTFKQQGREAYRKGVEEAVVDFGAHPAAYGFYLGDEPDGKDLQNTVDAYKILVEAAPSLTPFINFLPIWYDQNGGQDGGGSFKTSLGVSQKEYKALLNKLVKDAGLKCIGFDYYGQCNYYDFDNQYTKIYFENLAVFGQVARENNIPLYTSLLSVAHWGLRQVTQDDIRWQINTSVAMGTDGIFWFYLYERFLDGTFRVPPIDMFGAKTETYRYLARENKVFMKCIAPQLEKAKWVDVRTFHYDIPSIQAFETGDFGIKSISFPLADCPSAPLLITKFKDEQGDFVMLVNADQRLPVRIKVEPTDENAKGGSHWFTPGGLRFYRF